jgi:hypothetical protein
MSALPPKTDIDAGQIDVRFCAISGPSAMQQFCCYSITASASDGATLKDYPPKL